MKKHFLILMLMALLPMVGWAQSGTLSDKTVTVGKVFYGQATLPAVEVEGVAATNYEAETANYYTDAECTDAKAVSTLASLPVGTTKYYIKITGKNTYAGQQTSGWFVVEKKKLVLTYEADALNKPYGAKDVALDRTKFTSTDFKTGEDQSKLTLGTLTYTMDQNVIDGGNPVTFGECFTSNNYDITYAAYKATITPKTLTSADVTLGTISDKEYDGTANAPALSVTLKEGSKALTQGTPAAGTTPATGDYLVVPSSGSDMKSAGAQSVDINFRGNYTGTITSAGSFTISKKLIQVTVADITKEYSKTNYKGVELNPTSDPATFEYSGIATADAAKAAEIKEKFDATSASVVAIADAENPGNYALKISNVTNTATSTDLAYNYAITAGSYVDGKLIITPKELKLQANSTSKKVGEADPTFTLATTTGIAGDEITGVTLARENKSEDPGSYDITPDYSAAKVIRDKGKSTEKDVTAYYKFSIDKTKGKLTIEQGAIVVTIKDAEKFYGDEDPEFKFTVTGLQDGDELALTAADIKRSKGENHGTYSLTAEVVNPNPDKYKTLTVSEGIFTIKPAQLVFAMPAQVIDKKAKVTAIDKTIIAAATIWNDDKLTDLIDVAFNTSDSEEGAIPTGKVTGTGDDATIADEDATYANGYKVTLKAAVATAGNYVIWDAKKKTAVDKATGKIIVGAGSTSAIAFTSVDADFAKITGQSGETQAVTLTIAPRINREVPAGTKHVWAAQTWNTMVLPFEVSVADLSYALGYAIVNRVDATKTTEGNVVFKLEMDKIPANEPFCVKTSQAIAGTKVITFPNDVKIVAPSSEYPSVDAGQGYKFVGVYKGFEINNTTPDYYFLRGDNVKWANLGSTSTNTWQVVPFDAYIDQSGAAASARELTFTFEEIDGTTTAIKAVEADVVSKDSVKEGWYTIGGMKLQSAPTQKGVYINNGKKIIVK